MKTRILRKVSSTVLLLTCSVTWASPALALRQAGAEENNQNEPLRIALLTTSSPNSAPVSSIAGPLLRAPLASGAEEVKVLRSIRGRVSIKTRPEDANGEPVRSADQIVRIVTEITLRIGEERPSVFYLHPGTHWEEAVALRAQVIKAIPQGQIDGFENFFTGLDRFFAGRIEKRRTRFGTFVIVDENAGAEEKIQQAWSRYYGAVQNVRTGLERVRGWSGGVPFGAVRDFDGRDLGSLRAALADAFVNDYVVAPEALAALSELSVLREQPVSSREWELLRGVFNQRFNAALQQAAEFKAYLTQYDLLWSIAVNRTEINVRQSPFREGTWPRVAALGDSLIRRQYGIEHLEVQIPSHNDTLTILDPFRVFPRRLAGLQASAGAEESPGRKLFNYLIHNDLQGIVSKDKTRIVIQPDPLRDNLKSWPAAFALTRSDEREKLGMEGVDAEAASDEAYVTLVDLTGNLTRTMPVLQEIINPASLNPLDRLLEKSTYQLYEIVHVGRKGKSAEIRKINEKGRYVTGSVLETKTFEQLQSSFLAITAGAEEKNTVPAAGLLPKPGVTTLLIAVSNSTVRQFLVNVAQEWRPGSVIEADSLEKTQEVLLNRRPDAMILGMDLSKEGNWSALWNHLGADMPAFVIGEEAVQGTDVGETRLLTDHPRVSYARFPAGYARVRDMLVRLDAAAAAQKAGAEELRSIPAHKGAVVSLASSKDPHASRFVSAGADGTIRLWTWEGATLPIHVEGRNIGRLTHAGVMAVDVSSNGQAVLSVSSKEILRQNAAYGRGGTGLEFQEVFPAAEDMYPDSIAIGPHRRSVAVAGEGSSAVLVQNLDEKRGAGILWRLPMASGASPLSVSFRQEIVRPGSLEDLEDQARHLDGKFLVVGAADGSVEIWDLRDGPEKVAVRLPVLVSHQGKVVAVDFSPDGKFLATGDDMGKVLLWDTSMLDAKQVNLLRVINPEQKTDGRIFRMEFSPEGQLLATAAESGKIRLWDTQTGQEFTSPALLSNFQPVHSILFQPKNGVSSPRQQQPQPDPLKQTMALGLGDGSILLFKTRFAPADPFTAQPADIEKSAALVAFDPAAGVALHRFNLPAYVIAQTPTEAEYLISLGVQPERLIGLIWTDLTEQAYLDVNPNIRMFISGDPSQQNWMPAVFELIKQQLKTDQLTLIQDLESLAPALQRLAIAQPLIDAVFQVAAEAASVLAQMK